MLANSLYANGLITTDNLHELRTIPDKKRVAVLLSLIEKALTLTPHVFNSFITTLHSVRLHEVFADSLLHAYRFNIVAQRTKKVSEETLDLNYFTVELNNMKLISDVTRTDTASAPSMEAMCGVLLQQLQNYKLGTRFLDHLESFNNTRSISVNLRQLDQEIRSDLPPHDVSTLLSERQLDQEGRSDHLSRSHEFSPTVTKTLEEERRSADKHFSSELRSSKVSSIDADYVTEGDSDRFLSARSSAESDSFREFPSSEVVTFSSEPSQPSVKSVPYMYEATPTSSLTFTSSKSKVGGWGLGVWSGNSVYLIVSRK